VQAHEGRVRRELHEALRGRILDIQGMRFVAQAFEGVLHAVPRYEGDVPLHGVPTP